MKLPVLAVPLFLWLAAAPALHAQGQPAQDSEWMVVGPQGLKFYLDGCNRSYSGADSAVLYFGEATVPAGFPAMLLDAGVVQGPQANLGRLRPSQTAILAKGDALAYLERSFPVGTVVSIEPANAFPDFSITFPFNHLDTLDGGNNDLWVFTPAYQGESPHNPYRIQAEVKRGRVVRQDGGYANIPADGFLLAGHGTGQGPSGSTRVLNWCGIGCNVALDKDAKTITVTTDQQSWFLRAAALLGEAEQRLERNRCGLGATHLATGKAYLADARENLKKATRLAAKGLLPPAWLALRRSMDSSRLGTIQVSLPVKADSFRGLFLAGVSDDHLLQLSRAAGANALILLYDQSTVQDREGMKRLVKEANRLGMQVILWTFLPSRFSFYPETERTLKPDLASDGSAMGYDISESATRQAIVADLLRACAELNAAGVLFDYEWFTGGYGPSCIANFRQENPGIPASFDPRNMTPEQQTLHDRFLRAKLSAVVDAATKGLRAAGLKSILCAYPGGDFKDRTRGSAATPGPGIWLPWLAEGCFDSFMPMLYTASPTWTEKIAAEMFPVIRATSPATRIDPVLIFWPEICGWLSPVPLANLLAQSDVLLRHGADGVSYFFAPNLDAEFNPYFAWYGKGLRDGVCRNAFPPDDGR